MGEKPKSLKKLFLRIVSTLIVVIVFAALGVTGLFLSAFVGISEFYILFQIIFWVALFLFIYCKIWQRTWFKARLLFELLGVIAIGCVATYSYEAYDASIPKIQDSSEEGLYMPFSGNFRIARLDASASLKLESDLPRLDCATALHPIAAAFVEATYPHSKENYHPYEEKSLLKASKTPNVYQGLINGTVDIGFLAFPSKEQEEAAREKGIEFQFTPIAREGFIFFVNAKNPVDNLTIEQIQGIYSGEINRWSVVGGNSDRIRAFQRDSGSGSQTALIRLMDGKALRPAPTEDTRGGMGGIIQRTADYKNYGGALGFSFRFYATEMVKNEEIKLLKINGIAPTEENIRNGTYPLSYSAYAVTTNQGTNPNRGKFIEWMLSKEGQELIRRTGYTPIRGE
jgi:ABC-type phosphate transport system, periplasmic component